MSINVTGYTRALGLIGDPIRHSLSPRMYNYTFELLGIDYIYLSFPTALEDVGKAVEAAKLFDFIGFNVTMPCKQAVIPHLDRVTEQAAVMGAVNTVVNDNGMLIGYNTDGYGMLKSIQEENVPVQEKTITLFGTGGAATAIMVAMADAGIKTANIFNRKGIATDSLQEIINKTNKLAPNCKINLYSLESKEEINSSVKQSDIIINATPLGMEPHESKTPLDDKEILKDHMVVVDASYNPVETRLLREAKQLGCKTIDGRGMLLWQGAEAFRLFMQDKAQMPVEKVRKEIFA